MKEHVSKTGGSVICPLISEIVLSLKVIRLSSLKIPQCHEQEATGQISMSDSTHYGAKIHSYVTSDPWLKFPAP